MNGALGVQNTVVVRDRIAICPICRYHGHVVLADGTADVEVGSKTDFKKRIALLYRQKKISDLAAVRLDAALRDINLLGTLSSPLIRRILADIRRNLGGKADDCARYLELFLGFC